MTTIILDIETIPSQRPDARELVRNTLKAPGTLKKPESIAAWWANECEAALDEAYRKQSLDGGLFGEIISIALIAPDLDSDSGWSHCRAQGESESHLLTLFSDAVEARIDEAAKVLVDGYNFASDPYFVAHNASFDLPFLHHRCLVNGVRLPFKFPRPSSREGKDFGCTMVQWAGFGGRVSLDSLCKSLSVQTPKGDLHGSEVYDAWIRGEYDRIKRYNLSDVMATASVWERMQGATA